MGRYIPWSGSNLFKYKKIVAANTTFEVAELFEVEVKEFQSPCDRVKFV